MNVPKPQKCGEAEALRQQRHPLPGCPTAERQQGGSRPWATEQVGYLCQTLVGRARGKESLKLEKAVIVEGQAQLKSHAVRWQGHGWHVKGLVRKCF